MIDEVSPHIRTLGIAGGDRYPAFACTRQADEEHQAGKSAHDRYRRLNVEGCAASPARFLHGHVLRQNLVLNMAGHSFLRILVKLLRHAQNFPIDSDETKSGHFKTKQIRNI